MQKPNQPNPPSPQNLHHIDLCVDPLLVTHLEIIKKEVHKLITDLGIDSPGLLMHATKEVADDILVFTTYIKGTTVIVVHPSTEAEVLEQAFMALLPKKPGTWPETNPGNPKFN